MIDSSITFAEIADVLKHEATALAEGIELIEPTVERFPLAARGPRTDLAKLRRRARVLGAAHAIFRDLARYESEVHRLVQLSRRYAGRRRWWPFPWRKS